MGVPRKGKRYEPVNNDPELSESETESEEEEDEAGDVKLTEPSKTAVYNREGLLEKLEDITWPENLDWTHKLSLNIEPEQEVDVNDDLTRELAFYTQALEGARQALTTFQAKGVPFLRPVDYYAEMVKTDTHMVKVKGRLLAEKKRIEEADERRKSRENKKISKEIQAEKQKERIKQKKDEIESVKKWRKERKQNGFNDKDGDNEFPFEDGKSFERVNKKRPFVAPGDRSGGKGKQFGKGKIGSDKKKGSRVFKDSKFGFGGRKGSKKQNTAETTNDFRDFGKSEGMNKRQRKR